ncbi:hypothetical protein [Metaclostridioides mangenotii]|uniref:hypothetical protein n=1 Tax=Metaclostridioides mangenotii TaxID=1540 RepID=UPI0028EE45D0|nr:hypothetical protein [Clostridioides mangenotii]
MDYTEITRDEFIENNYGGDICPAWKGLENYPDLCENKRVIEPDICKVCWTKAVDGIKFKDDLKDLFEEKTVLRFNARLDGIVGKPIKLLDSRDTNTYIYGLVKFMRDGYMAIQFTDRYETYDAEELVKLDPTILEYKED